MLLWLLSNTTRSGERRDISQSLSRLRASSPPKLNSRAAYIMSNIWTAAGEGDLARVREVVESGQ